MTLAHARALLPGETQGVHVEPFNPKRDDDALHTLAIWATRFAPIVTPDRYQNDGLLMDITGCQRLYHGDNRLVHRLTNAVQRLGFTHVHVATAPTFGAAWAIARFGHDHLTPSGISPAHDAVSVSYCRGRVQHLDTHDLRRLLAPLPMPALRIDQDTVNALNEIGITRIGHLLNLPRRSLPARFGDQLLRRLDQALGDAVETIEPVQPAVSPRVRRDFDGPVKQLEAIRITVRTLLTDLAQHMQQREGGAQQLELELTRCDASPVQVTIQLTRPSRDPKHLWALLGPKIEWVNLGLGVECITLTASSIGRLRHHQIEPWRDPRHDPAQIESLIGRLLDTLTARLGSDRITRIEPAITHIPECAYQQRPVMEEVARSEERRVRSKSIRSLSALSPDRPSVLFDRPEPIHVIALTTDGPPTWLRWRRGDTRLIASFGPERIAQTWWEESNEAILHDGDEPEQARDYFKVQDEHGRWLWIYRELESGQWFVHGQWV